MNKTEEKSRNPLLNVFVEEWKYLGDRKKLFLLYLSLFVIAGVITLMTLL